MIKEYMTIFKEDDEEILNMKAIISIMNNEFENAEKLLKKSWILNSVNYNTIFNIGYLHEILGNTQESMRFYGVIVNRCKDDEIVLDAKEKVSQYKTHKD